MLRPHRFVFRRVLGEPPPLVANLRCVLFLRLRMAGLADAVARHARVNRVLFEVRRRGPISVAACHRLVIHDAEAIARRLL